MLPAQLHTGPDFYSFVLKDLFLFIQTHKSCIRVWVCACEHRHSWRSEALGLLGAGVRGCELPSVGAGNWTQVL